MTLNDFLAAARRFGRQLGLKRPALTLLESSVINAVASALGPQERDALLGQLSALDLVQRSPGKRLCAIYLETSAALPLLSHVEPDYCLARLQLKAASRTLRVEVMAHRGLLSSIEFHGSPQRLEAGDFIVADVVLNPAAIAPSVEAVIDRFGHGRSHA